MAFLETPSHVPTVDEQAIVPVFPEGFFLGGIKVFKGFLSAISRKEFWIGLRNFPKKAIAFVSRNPKKSGLAVAGAVLYNYRNEFVVTAAALALAYLLIRHRK